MTHLNVAVRIRPLSERETEVKAVPVVDILNKNVVAVTNLKVLEHNAGDSRERVRRFSFDHCFDKNTTQEQVFEAVENVLGDALSKRYHTCVLAYGQSSSGKTHTIMGMDDDPGLAPRLCQSVFNYVREAALEDEERKGIAVSYLEIYNERVKDLLSPNGRQNSLRVREHPSRGTYVQGLTHHVVTDSNDLLEWLQSGNKKRRVSATSINPQSSRSHSVFTITCFGGVKLTLVDLAGSERTGSRSFNNSSTFREGANINKSLVALGNVIFALADQSKSSRKRYVPYRDSVLTWLLKDTLGGNSKTVMIATISPSHTCYNETVNTLRFGHRAKQIIARPVSNEDPKQKTIRDLKIEVTRLKDLLLKYEIDPDLQFCRPKTAEVLALKTIDQSTNTEEPTLDENLQVTSKILDGLLEQIRTKLKDDFKWCKEELLRNSGGGEGVFGEIIRNSFGKKLVCKEYTANITQVYNVPEFKVFVYSDGKNIPGIEGVEQNVLESVNRVPLVNGSAAELNALPNVQASIGGVASDEIVTQGVSNISLVDQDITEKFGQNTSNIIPVFVPTNKTVTVNNNLNVEVSNKGITKIEEEGLISDIILVGENAKEGHSNAVSTNQNVISNQLVNENVIKTEQNTSNKQIVDNLCDSNVTAVSQGAATIQLVNEDFIKVIQTCPKATPRVDLSNPEVTSTEPINEGVPNTDLTIRKVYQGLSGIQLVNESVVKADQNNPKGDDSSTQGIANAIVDSIVQNIAKGTIDPKPVGQVLAQHRPVTTNITKDISVCKPLDLKVSKLNTAAKKVGLWALYAATDKLIPVMDVSSAVSGSEKPVVKLRRTFSVCSAEMESKKTKMYGSYETLSKYQQPEPQLRKRSLDKSSSSVRNLKDKASTESVPDKVKSANDVTKTFSKVEAKVDSIRKIPNKPRAEIVAAVTQRLYTKIKKKEVATETDDIIREHKGTLARIRLQDITQRALRACRRRHAESQTETLPVQRVKETATDVQDLKIEAAEMKHVHVSTQEVITKDAAVNHTQEDTFDQISGQSLIVTKSFGVQVSESPPTPSSKEDQQHLLSFTKYLRAQREPKIEVAHRTTANPIYTSSVNINVSHNYINRTDSISGDSLEDQNNTNAVLLPTPDLISNHNSLEAEKANQIESQGLPQACVVKEERCRLLPTYQKPKMFKLRVTETKPHETSFSIERPPTILKSIVKQNNDQDQSDCASDCSDTSPRAFENVPDSLSYHFNKNVRFDEEPMSERVLEVMTNFLKEATSLMTNLAAAATNKFDADQSYDLQVTVTDAGNIINRGKPRRRPRRRRSKKNETGSQTCVNYEHAVSQTSPKKTSEKSVETDGEVPENKYECLVRNACDRLERCADAISGDWYGPVQPEDSSMESNVTFSDYGSLPRQKFKHKPSCSPRAFLKELTSMRRQVIDSSREELVSESRQNCG